MKVCEIFLSIQGESTYAGMPCVFIRLTGCNLRCSYCDTAYAYDEGSEMSMDEVLSLVSEYGVKLVEITGGEPLMSEDAPELARKLIKEGYKVLLETNGSVDISPVPKEAVVIMDIKTPSSLMSDQNRPENIPLLKSTDEVKFVISDREDYLWSRDLVHKHGLSNKCTVLLAPAFGQIEPSTLVGWMLEDSLRVRLNLQLHKIIFDPNQRGV